METFTKPAIHMPKPAKRTKSTGVAAGGITAGAGGGASASASDPASLTSFLATAVLTHAIVANAEPSHEFAFETSSGEDLWHALSKADYGNFQPVVELVDNCIAAIKAIVNLMGKIDGGVFINFNFKDNMGRIEHYGGETFPTTIEEISRCFRYGGKKPTTLNEHGCGLKSSLAILDPLNKQWKIWIKHIVDGKINIYSISSPYSNKMVLVRETTWPGKHDLAQNGTLIEFPIMKERFSELYSTKDAKMNEADLHLRIKCHLSHMWMEEDDVRSNNIKIYYNDEYVQPFTFRTEAVYEYVQNIHKPDGELRLSTGATVHIEQIKLKNTARKIPGSFWFKYALSANGIYLYKNGRFIESINSDNGGRRLYSRIIGSVPDHSHNGTIIIVNVKGGQTQLPVTAPTKNRFNDTPLFFEMIDLIAANIRQPKPHTRDESEDSLLNRYQTLITNSIKVLPIPLPHFKVEREKKLLMADGVYSPGIDMIVDYGDERYPIDIYEAKNGVSCAPEHISQLFLNWSCAVDAYPGKTIKPILLINATDDYKVSETHKCYLQQLAIKFGFKPEIRTYKNEILYRQI